MNRLFILLFGMVTFAAHAQVPDYVPTEGLLAWYPFNGNANDESENGFDGMVNGAMLTSDRFLAPNSAYSFTGNCEDRIDMLIPEMTENSSFSVSFWVKRNGTGCHNPRMWEFYGGSRTTQCGWFNDWDYITFSGFPIVNATLENDNWYHFTLTNNGYEWNAYFNGELNNTVQDTTIINSPDLAIGRMNHPAWDSFNGDIDDFAIWNRALTEEEIAALFNAQLPTPGCTDIAACNYNDEATNEDGSCIYPLFGDDCETGSAACGEGTVWDSASQSCLAWNDCPSDLDGDGVIGVSDLMELLADFGTECPPEVAEWTCGDPANYHGYDYATVQIGDQCWFAENLQTDRFANDELISNANSWIYGDDSGINCISSASFMDACDITQSLAMFGRLYSMNAVLDSQGLCPNNWHVPSDEEWMQLEAYIGIDEAELNEFGWRGTDQHGLSLRSINGWNYAQGLDTYGFGAKAGGYIDGNLDFIDAGVSGHWWTSTTGSGNLGIKRELSWVGVLRGETNPIYGHSVRCVAD